MFPAVFPMKPATELRFNKLEAARLKLYLLRRVVFKSSFMGELMLNPLNLLVMKNGRYVASDDMSAIVWEE
jgi:hypothetical protein